MNNPFQSQNPPNPVNPTTVENLAGIAYAAIDGNGHVIPDPASYGANGGAILYDANGKVLLKAGAALKAVGQVGNTGGGSTPNQFVGVATMPSGTANGGTVTINHALVTAASIIFLTFYSYNNLALLGVPGRRVGSFDVQVTTIGGAPTPAAWDFAYLIFN